MCEWHTHITVDHGVNVVLVELLDGWGCEEEVGVVSSIAPLQIVDLGVSCVPLVPKSQNELDPIVSRTFNDVVQCTEGLFIVYTWSRV